MAQGVLKKDCQKVIKDGGRKQHGQDSEKHRYHLFSHHAERYRLNNDGGGGDNKPTVACELITHAHKHQSSLPRGELNAGVKTEETQLQRNSDRIDIQGKKLEEKGERSVCVFVCFCFMLLYG